jgi:hypothetical protein
MGIIQEETKRQGWTKWLTPSLSDFFFIAVLSWTFLIGSFGWVGLLADGDTGWHIRTGQWIFAEGRVPYTDLFSFSKMRPMVCLGIGSDLWFAFLYDHFSKA